MQRRQQQQPQQSAQALLAQLATPLPSLDDYDSFTSLFDQFGDAQVVLLGEATHGSSEFYRARHLITRRLVEKHGFSLVTFEADYPDMGHVNRYCKGLSRHPFPKNEFSRFPQWMWRNEEFKEFVLWLRDYNKSLSAEKRISLRGLDVYSLQASVHAVLEYLDKHDPEMASVVRKRYECVTPHFSPPSLFRTPSFDNACQKKCVATLNELLEKRFEFIQKSANDDPDEAFLDAEQNARIVRAAEAYYTSQWTGRVNSWNLRDKHMFDTLLRMCKVKPGAKAIVWAHNSHLGNAASTEMGANGEWNIGELCRKHFGDECVSIGFSTSVGTVAAASHWDGEVEFKSINPPRHDSWEHTLSAVTHNSNALFTWRNEPAAREELGRITHLERAIGVVYVKHSERASHYFEADLAHQFDAVVHFHQSNHVRPLPHVKEDHTELDDTYPFGL